MMNGMYAAQKIIKKAIFFTEHDLVQSEHMIDGRTCLFVLAGTFLIVAQFRIASIPNSQACSSCKLPAAVRSAAASPQR
jgi:hypothetical protein